MGHYRSEMGYEDEDEERARYAARKENETREIVREMIKKDGIEETLVQILLDLRSKSIVLPTFHKYSL